MTDTIQDRLRGDIYEAMLENARDMTEEQEAQRSAAAAHIDAQDAKIRELVEVAHRVPERWAWGSGPSYRRRVCKDCGAVGEYDSWDSPLPHKLNCNYAIARTALAAAKETSR